MSVSDNERDIPSYNGNPLIKRKGVQIQWTQEQLLEYMKCANDPIYFIETYMKIIHVDRGLVSFNMYDYQKEMVSTMAENRFTLIGTCRQAGKSTSTSGFILWYIIFNKDKTVALLANKGETAREILGKVQLAYQHLPKWLQQGVIEWNKGSFVLENNSRVIASATSSDNIRGYSISLLFIDEAAHIENWDEFFASVFPTISSGFSTKIVLVSTPNGLNHFYKLWEQSEQGLNEYKRVRVLWNQVPGRDDAWKQSTLSSMGYDHQKFAQEHEMEFLGSSGTLIAGWKLKELVSKVPEYSKINIHQYKKPEHNRIYTVIADVAEGKGLDYSAFQVIDVTEMPYVQVCTFRDNMITPIDYSEIIHRIAKSYNNAAILIEINNIGQQIAENIYYEYEYENIIHTTNSGRLGKTTSMGFGKAAEKGIRTTKSVKSIGCSMLKMLVEGNQLILNDFDTIKELSTFSRKNNSFEAEPGNNDDLVMCLVLFGWLTEQIFFKEYTNINTLNRLREKTDEELMENIMPFGMIDDGSEFINELVQKEEDDSYANYIMFL